MRSAERCARVICRLVLVALWCHAAPASADEIYFTSGELLKGLVVEEHVDRLVVSTVDGEQVVLRQEIDEVFFDDPERNYLYLGNEALAEGDTTAATALFHRALRLNPRWQETRDALQRVEDRQRKTAAGWALDDPEQTLWTTWGVRWTATDGYPAVAAVASQQAMDRAGVRVGDQLVAVWGESMGFRPIAHVAERLLGPPGTPVKVTIQRGVTLRAGAVPWPGFELTMAPAGLTVSRVAASGASAGVEAGDLIVALDHRPTRYLPLAVARATIGRARGRDVDVRLQRHLVIIRPPEE